ncbi:C-type lectin domain-containing protein [Sorangium sp. KYC3313]|uniref:C-type lectin domain-containing protein n=1 Tax=Sorangium sp. KYC3313 TaxID=3449740 RepID=UPI003F88C2CB
MSTVNVNNSIVMTRGLGIALLAAGASLAALGCVAGEGQELYEGEDVAEAAEAVTFGGHDYLFVTNLMSWSAARSYCVQNGYDLVTISSPAEQAFLTAEETSRASSPFWIGYNDRGVEGTFTWASGEPAVYVNWRPGQPNNDNSQDCVEDNSQGTFQWSDVDCSSDRHFICERGSVPGQDGTVAFNVSNTKDATKNTQDVPLNLNAGMLLTFGTCGVAGASKSGDTLIRLIGPSGDQLRKNDDACGGTGSNLSYVLPTTGTYILRVGCHGSGSCSGTMAYTY